MSEILIKPTDLITASTELRAHAKSLQDALNIIDTEIQSLGIGRFDEARAKALRARYDRIKEQTKLVKPLIDRFALDLENAASRLQAADNI
jgi:hypothetical protein